MWDDETMVGMPGDNVLGGAMGEVMLRMLLGKDGDVWDAVPMVGLMLEKWR